MSGSLKDMGDLACELCLQRDLATRGHAVEKKGLQALPLDVVEGDRAAGDLAPARLRTAALPAGSATMTPSSETDVVTTSVGVSWV